MTAPESAGINLDVISDRSLPDLVADRIAKAIQDGSLKPGDRLPTEHEFVQRLGVGRTSVREGLQKLQALGLVETRKGRGTFVSHVGGDDVGGFPRWSAMHRFAISEMLEIRMGLEATAAGLAAQRASSSDLSEIERRHFDHVAAAKRGTLGEIVGSDEHFHRAIAKAAGNRALSRMLEGLAAEAMEFRRRTHALPGGPNRSTTGHQAILEAIRRGDPCAARLAMVQHLWHLYEQVHVAADADSAGSISAAVASPTCFGDPRDSSLS